LPALLKRAVAVAARAVVEVEDAAVLAQAPVAGGVATQAVELLPDRRLLWPGSSC
jgi:hypothetical protein